VKRRDGKKGGTGAYFAIFVPSEKDRKKPRTGDAKEEERRLGREREKRTREVGVCNRLGQNEEFFFPTRGGGGRRHRYHGIVNNTTTEVEDGTALSKRYRES